MAAMDTEGGGQNQIVIYQTPDGQTQIDVRMTGETVWLTQEMIVTLFQSSKANISEHISHIYREGELDRGPTVRKFRTVRMEGGRKVARNLEYYNLDMVLSLGYRVNSKIATRFRIWATAVLKKYLSQGYAVNEKLLEKEQGKRKALQETLRILSRSFETQIERLCEARAAVKILSAFSDGLDLLDAFDHQTLSGTGKNDKKAVRIETGEFLTVVAEMKGSFPGDLFARPKDESFASSVNQIYQSYGGKDCYPTLEEKAAMLLYLIVKNHSFYDGNKRVAAACFLYFLERNGILYQSGSPVLDGKTVFALTLLIASSKPCERETMKQVCVSLLNRLPSPSLRH